MSNENEGGRDHENQNEERERGGEEIASRHSNGANAKMSRNSFLD